MRVYKVITEIKCKPASIYVHEHIPGLRLAYDDSEQILYIIQETDKRELQGAVRLCKDFILVKDECGTYIIADSPDICEAIKAEG